jgi:hypothetical protein
MLEIFRVIILIKLMNASFKNYFLVLKQHLSVFIPITLQSREFQPVLKSLGLEE